jgi:hypothetical protein
MFKIHSPKKALQQSVQRFKLLFEEMTAQHMRIAPAVNRVLVLVRSIEMNVESGASPAALDQLREAREVIAEIQKEPCLEWFWGEGITAGANATRPGLQ